MTILSNEFDDSLGGRDIDEILVDKIAELFQAKHHSDPRKNPKSLLKLRKAAEKCKLSLSPQGVTHAEVDIENLAEDMDFHTRIQLSDLEGSIKSKNIHTRLIAIVEKALKSAGITIENISSTEITGGSLRIPLLKRTLGEYLHYDLSVNNFGLKTTLNMDECVAIGCTLYNAVGKWKYEINECDSIKCDKLNKGLTQQQINSIKGIEGEMERQDERLREKAEKRNQLESTIYSYKGKIDTLKNVPPRKLDNFKNYVEGVQDWLDSEESEYVDSYEYERKLKLLQSEFDNLTFVAPKNERKEAYAKLGDTVKEYEDIANSFVFFKYYYRKINGII